MSAEAFAAVCIFVAVTTMAIVVVRAFDKALRLSRAVPKGDSHHDQEIARVRDEVAQLRSRTLREDVADLEQRFAEREGGR